jgi:cytochrome c553
MSKILIGAGSALALVLAAGSAFAAGNAADGKIKAYSCTGCHGITGYRNAYPHYHVPKIHGQNAAYLIAALNAYKNGDRPHPTMRAQGQSLSDEDIADIAAYLSTAEGK